MTITTPSILRKYLNFLLPQIGILFVSCVFLNAHSRENDSIPAFLVGVHHLGPDYFVHGFYINKSIGDNISEGGGGGSRVCCISIPKKWQSTLTVDVRWEVAHIIKSANPIDPETAEIEGIYHAQVPVEQYAEAGDFYVHFFSNGRVRVVVSPTTSSGKQHPIRWGDKHASEIATKGTPVNALFTAAEVAEHKRIADQVRKDHGGWR